jgi:hypothetical protein
MSRQLGGKLEDINRSELLKMDSEVLRSVMVREGLL